MSNKLFKCQYCGGEFSENENYMEHWHRCNKQYNLEQDFHNAISAIEGLEKWFGTNADIHITMSKILNTLRVLEHEASKKHFPVKTRLQEEQEAYIRAQAKTFDFIEKKLFGGDK